MASATLTKANLFGWLRDLGGAPARDPLRQILITGITLLLFLGLWHVTASRVHTSLGQLPGPVQVAEQARGLWAEHREERGKEAAFYERQQARNDKKLEKNPQAEVK